MEKAASDADWPAFVAQWKTAAAEWQAAADAAPQSVRQAQERLAGAAHDTLTELRKVDPKSQQEIQAAVNQVTKAVTAKDGNLDADSSAADAELQKTCGFSMSSPPSGTSQSGSGH